MVLDRHRFLGIHFFSMSHFDGKKDPTLPAEEEGPYRKTVAFKQKTQTQKNGHYRHKFFATLLLLLIEAMDTSSAYC